MSVQCTLAELEVYNMSLVFKGSIERFFRESKVLFPWHLSRVPFWAPFFLKSVSVPSLKCVSFFCLLSGEVGGGGSKFQSGEGPRNQHLPMERWWKERGRVPPAGL